MTRQDSSNDGTQHKFFMEKLGKLSLNYLFLSGALLNYKMDFVGIIRSLFAFSRLKAMVVFDGNV